MIEFLDLASLVAGREYRFAELVGERDRAENACLAVVLESQERSVCFAKARVAKTELNVILAAELG
jgi:hypothetical protein